ncbi:AfsR/SARP family transcriptional regulator [Chitinibacteraceae bacterium HSL-7]
MSDALQLSLFGSMTLLAGSQALTLGGRVGSLLAFLALERGRFFSRTELCSALSGDRSEPMNTGALNTALWRLRKAVEPHPEAQGRVIGRDRRGGIGLLHGTDLTLDVEEFERLVQPALTRPIDTLTEAEVGALRRGVTLYKADILSGFDDDWALREREKLRRSYLNAHGRLMRIDTLTGEYASAIRHAQAILDCDELREDVHRELMLLYVHDGQRAQALRQFEYCRALLRRELAIQPMPETLALYQRIADSAITPSHPVITPTTEPVIDVRVQLEQARQLLAQVDAHLASSLGQLGG